MKPNGKNPDGEAKGAERRISPRLGMVNFVWFKVLDEEEGDFPSEGVAKMVDISETGLGLQVSRPIQKEDSVLLEIVTRHFTLSALGKIIYSRPVGDGTHRVGITFAAISPNNRIKLGELFGSDEGE